MIDSAEGVGLGGGSSRQIEDVLFLPFLIPLSWQLQLWTRVGAIGRVVNTCVLYENDTLTDSTVTERIIQSANKILTDIRIFNKNMSITTKTGSKY